MVPRCCRPFFAVFVLTVSSNLHQGVAEWNGDQGGSAMTALPAGTLPRGSGLPLTATLGALGGVYGDIGTSPRYALKEAAKAAAHGGELPDGAICGIVSMSLWALILIISAKYALLILRADNREIGRASCRVR